jgi:Tn3 transposase DDE domain
MAVPFRSAGRIVNLVVVAVFCWRTRLINSRLTGKFANLLIFHNVVTMTKALQLLMADGNPIDEESLACLSPYQTEHINRFERYALNRDRVPEPLDRVRVLRMPPRSEGLPVEKIKKSVTF